MDEEGPEEVVFYSNNELEAPEMMEEEVNMYFGWFLNISIYWTQITW